MEVHLHTNNSCNLRCLHCYNRSVYGKSVEYLNSDEIVNVVSFFYKRYNAEFHMEGGEIFLNPEVFDALEKLEKLHSCLDAITITTNGTIFPQDTGIFELLRKIHALRISVEGHNDIENIAVRGIGLSEVLNNARRYCDKNINVWLRITLTSVNYQDMIDRTLQYFINMGFHKIQIYEFQPVGRGADNVKKFYIDHSLKNLLLSLINNGVYENAYVKIMLPKRRIAEVESYGDKLNSSGIKIHLLPVKKGISIHSDGNVFCCSWDDNPQHALFNVRDITASDSASYMDMLDNLIKQHNLVHDCEYCSAIMLDAGEY